jgi:membrane protease YdiL (CAAX protease family)
MSSRRDISKEISGLLLVVLSLLLGLSICRQWLPDLGLGLTVLIYGVVYFIPMMIYNKTHRYKARSALRLKAVKIRYWPFILLFGLSVCLICALINLGTGAFCRMVLHLEAPTGNIVDLSSANPGVLLLTGVLLPAFSEEFLLRGLVQSEYEKYGVTIGVLLTAVIFALFHTNPVQIPALIVAGVCYGVLTLIFKSVWPAAIAHAINNGVAVLMTKYSDFIRYIFQDRLFLLLALIGCFLILIITLKMLENVLDRQLGAGRRLKKSARTLAYGDPLMSPWLWIFALLCIGKMIYNGFFN